MILFHRNVNVWWDTSNSVILALVTRVLLHALIIFFVFLGPHPRLMGDPRLGVESKL